MSQAAVQPWCLLISRTNLEDARLAAQSEAARLAAGEARLRIEKFAFTASNITYAAMGEHLYWRLFPADAGFGKLPVWGYAVVEESAAPGLEVGQRVRGCLPLASHVRIQAKVEAGAVLDISPHRAQLPPFYSQYVPVTEIDGVDADQRILLLFGTAFLLDGLVADNQAFGAHSIVLTSASSKTALGTAFLLQRRGLKVIGITSPEHRAFTSGTGYYHKVIAYQDIDRQTLAAPLCIIDFAGNPTVLRSLHGRFADQIVHTCCVGRTHWHASSDMSNLPGPAPQGFLAFDRMATRVAQLGAVRFGEEYAKSWNVFSTDAARWLKLHHHYGPQAALEAYLATLAGTVEPDDGQIVDLRNAD